ncbi:hypothetical protein [Chryseobacterium populi]|uniref:Lipoprotein n=1 Tax=Chryseobacterium populi TaxID=1144316 RepID=J3CM06_9FLAO|nr:hypothetical protein [Chryseobacterium populi]EJL74344.1 hypothetical protein PMI13_01083 [Chryseobacterium populi]
MNKRYKLLFNFAVTFLFISCTAQENPNYIGKQFVSFDLNKVTFQENLDTLFSKINKFDLIVIPDTNSRFDTLQNKISNDPVAFIYRVKHKNTDGLYSFQNLKVKEVVSFYTDNQNRFRRVDFAMYLSEPEYQNLLSTNKDYKDITTDEVRKFNNNKYQILQKVEKKKATTFYCLETRDNLGDYFVRIRISDLNIIADEFDKKWNSKRGY